MAKSIDWINNELVHSCIYANYYYYVIVSNSKQKGTNPKPDPLHVWQNPYVIGMQNSQISKKKKQILREKYISNTDQIPMEQTV